MKDIFLFFHLNLAFSSLREKDKKILIKKCYWQILQIIEKNQIPISIEMTGYTLSEIFKLDRGWIKKFIELEKKGLTSLIGSGYCQIIGPSSPYKINNLNLKIGNRIYKKILNIIPKTLHVNEQCFSKSLVDIAYKNKFKNIIMEFENPHEFNNKIKFSDKYFHHKVLGLDHKLNLIWNSSINFQKFQRYIHGKDNENDYLNFIKKTKGNFYCLYGSDGEVFDFRPKRNFQDEKIATNEWKKINLLLKKLKIKYNFKIFEDLIINKNFLKKSYLDLTSSNMPCPTKKQEKYNINRWSITSHSNHKLNTRCFLIFKTLNKKKIKINHIDWKKLIYFFSSDFRTHIEKNREKKLNHELSKIEKKYQLNTKKKFVIKKSKINKKFTLVRNEDKITIKYKSTKFSLNLKRFLSLNYFINEDISKKPLIGTLKQGFFDKTINYDVFSGHLIAEQFQKKITDISFLSRPKIFEERDTITFFDKILTNELRYEKSITFSFKDLSLKFNNKVKFFKNTPISIRNTYVTLNPKAFDRRSLKYLVKNGGTYLEAFKFNKDISFGKRVSNLVTSTTGLGFDDGKLIIKDNYKKIIIINEHEKGYAIPFIEFQKINRLFFLRVCFSVRENDDTSKDDKNKVFTNSVKINFQKQL